MTNELGRLTKFKNFCRDTLFDYEKELHVRIDFIEIYGNIVTNAPDPIKKRFISQSNFFYYSKIQEFSDYVHNLDPYAEIIKGIKRPLEKFESISSGIDLASSILDILTFIFLFSTITLFWLNVPQIISLISSALTILLVLINSVLYILFFSSSFVKEILENLLIKRDDLSELQLNIRKNTLIGAYVWDHSICTNPVGTIRSYLILLLIKSISKTIFNMIKSGLIGFVPKYMRFPKKERDGLNLAKKIWSKSGLIERNLLSSGFRLNLICETMVTYEKYAYDEAQKILQTVRQNVTINVVDYERLDFCAFPLGIEDDRIIVPHENGWESPSITGPLKKCKVLVTSENAEPVEANIIMDTDRQEIIIE